MSGERSPAKRAVRALCRQLRIAGVRVLRLAGTAGRIATGGERIAGFVSQPARSDRGWPLAVGVA
eukprot:826179-Alexandrium_andersonii.AAC.1